ncbi:MAG: PQQ-dependent sugar dehydrogenase [Candidatus Nanopelagicaceae bacterium]
MNFVLSPLIALLLVIQPTASANIRVDNLPLNVKSISIADARSLGGNDRGPALEVLSDGTLLLGGGDKGGSLFIWSERKPELIPLGNFISARERIRDSRFAITDIAILRESENSLNLLISFPRLTNKNCVEVVVDEISLNLKTANAKRVSRWFTSKPCVPVSAVQHAAGRMEVINSKSVYLTIGDLGYRKIDSRSLRGDLGSVFKISKKKVEKISSGHRNQQGILLFDGRTLITSEHGPRGGDEINVIERGIDYGWPFVTYGEPYTQGDYVIPKETGTHKGFREPIKVWTPSIAPTELIQLPENGFGKFSGGIAMGTLRDMSLVFMIFENGKITASETVNIGARIRDLDVMPDQRLVAATDDGRLMFISK